MSRWSLTEENKSDGGHRQINCFYNVWLVLLENREMDVLVRAAVGHSAV